jgi:hypothetical protein
MQVQARLRELLDNAPLDLGATGSAGEGWDVCITSMTRCDGEAIFFDRTVNGVHRPSLVLDLQLRLSWEGCLIGTPVKRMSGSVFCTELSLEALGEGLLVEVEGVGVPQPLRGCVRGAAAGRLGAAGRLLLREMHAMLGLQAPELPPLPDPPPVAAPAPAASASPADPPQGADARGGGAAVKAKKPVARKLEPVRSAGSSAAAARREGVPGVSGRCAAKSHAAGATGATAGGGGGGDHSSRAAELVGWCVVALGLGAACCCMIHNSRAELARLAQRWSQRHAPLLPPPSAPPAATAAGAGGSLGRGSGSAATARWQSMHVK